MVDKIHILFLVLLVSGVCVCSDDLYMAVKMELQ